MLESVVRELGFVPFVQWIRTERYERSDSGSSPERDTKKAHRRKSVVRDC